MKLIYLHIDSTLPKIQTDPQILARKKTLNAFYKRYASIEEDSAKLKDIKKNKVNKAMDSKQINENKNKTQNEFLNRNSKKQGIMLVNELWSKDYHKKILFNSEILQKTRQIEKLKIVDNDVLVSNFEKVFNFIEKKNRKKNQNFDIFKKYKDDFNNISEPYEEELQSYTELPKIEGIKKVIIIFLI